MASVLNQSARDSESRDKGAIVSNQGDFNSEEVRCRTPRFQTHNLARNTADGPKERETGNGIVQRSLQSQQILLGDAFGDIWQELNFLRRPVGPVT